MKTKSTITVLVAALAVLSGAMGMTMTGVFSDQGLMTANNKNGATALMTGLSGHLEIEAYSSNGELFAYRQFDNAVVDDGEQCILKLLFATSGTNANSDGRGEYTSTGNGHCTGALTGAWDVIAIGTGTTAGSTETLVKLDNEITSNGMPRGVATEKNWTNGTIPQIVMKKTFTSTQASGTTAVTESGLFNSTTADGSGMLARNNFDAVTLSNGDSITITWTFKVGDN